MRIDASILASMIILTALVCGVGVAFGQEDNESKASTDAEQEIEMPFVLLLIQGDIWGNLSDMDNSVAAASNNLSASGLEGDEARAVLKGLINSNPGMTEAITLSKDGKILASESNDNKGAEGEDISSQEAVAQLLRTMNPVMSEPFQTVEGFEAIALMYPVFSESGEFLGGISVTFKPDEVLRALVAPRLNMTGYDSGYSFWIMQTDGQIVYDQDASQIGKMLFEDPLYKPYKSLLYLGRVMASERAGHGSYDFQVTESNNAVVSKDVYWTTVGLHGREWRLALTRIKI